MSIRPCRLAALAPVVAIALTLGCASSPRFAGARPSTAALMQPGVSLELARHRAATLSEVSYDLALDLSGTDSVPGAVTIFFVRAAGSGDLVLDFRGLAVLEVMANEEVVEDYRHRDGHILIPAAHLLDGSNAVAIRFVSVMAPSGAAIIRFDESVPGAPPGVVGDSYRYSLLVPADANLLFPSFDQPDLKAIVRLEVIAPEGSTVLSNAPEADRSLSDLGLWTRFQPTQPISTYLHAVAVGPWVTWSDPAGAMTLYARRSLAADVDADSLIATNRRALAWLEDYFRVPYPFAKLDLLLAPAFPFGGMEHPGAIFYNESRFVFREPPTWSDRLARDATIYHEVAHQWFGDLVTMRWFDDLWLKEGFSTYMAARMQEELHPGQDAWKTFYLRNKPLAYAVDVTSGTTPVWQSLENLDLAKSNYGPIVYNKAPAILKQLEFAIGEQAFRYGLQVLLRRHAYGNIDWRQLLAVMEEASGRDLDAFGEQYILRAGAPVVETRVESEGGRITRLRLVQRPTVSLGDPGQGWWPGSVRVRLAYPDRDDLLIPVAFTGPETDVPEAVGQPLPDYVFPNDGDFGYGIFLLDEGSATHLLRGAGSIEDGLLRTLAWGALWDGVQEGRLPVGEFVGAVLREMPDEADEQIAGFLLARVMLALDRYLPQEAPATADLRMRFERALLAGIDDSRATYDLRKTKLDVLLAAARTPESLRILRDYLGGARQFDGAPILQPSRWSAAQTLIAMGAADADSIIAAESQRDDSAERERRAFIAGAARPTAAAKQEYFRRYLDDLTLNEEWVTASLGAFNHPAHAELSSPYLAEALDRLPWVRQNRRIFFVPQWINAFVGGQASAASLARVDDYLARNPDLPPDLRLKVLQARDGLARAVALRGGP